MPLCPTCKSRPRGSTRKGTPLDYCDVCHRHRTIETQHAFKEACIEFAGGECIDCGYSTFMGSLNFVRRPGEPRTPRISRLAGRVPLTQSVKDELLRRDLLCTNCWRARTQTSTNTPALKLLCIAALGGYCTVCDRGCATMLPPTSIYALTGVHPTYKGVSLGQLAPSAFEFHHTIPSGKLFSLGDRKSPNSFGEIREELSKCVLVCANCHREEHGRLDALRRAKELVAL